MNQPLKDKLLQVLAAVEQRVDGLIYASRDRLGLTRGPILLTYRGHGQGRKLHLRARVIEDPGLTPSEHDDSYFQNALGTLRRFKTFDLAGARVRFTHGDASCEATADAEGHVRATLTVSGLPPGKLWHDVEASLVHSPRHPAGNPARATLPVVVPTPAARFCIVSDVDDTVLETQATRFLMMLRVTLLGNAYTRLPFEGVSAFYRALTFGTGTAPDNPVFYVSSSPWNLYDLLQDFFRIEGLPSGPLFLRDFGITPKQFIVGGHGSHKREAIDELLETHPGLPFILIGDSGQEDPEIYAAVARDHPRRILVIYIRDVTAEKRGAEVHGISTALGKSGVEMVLVKDSLEAARDAVRRGFIPPEALSQVAAARKRDQEAD
jgi:phosphatidate phosphatase APP1